MLGTESKSKTETAVNHLVFGPKMEKNGDSRPFTRSITQDMMTDLIRREIEDQGKLSELNLNAF